MRTLILLAGLALPLAAAANYEKALEAMQKKDSAAVRTQLTAAAKAGDRRAYLPLAKFELQNAKSVDDLRAAQQWALKAAADDAPEAPDAQFVFYAATVSLPDLNYVNRDGKVDAARYKALAARPISDREDEMTAYDMLGKAAQKGQPQASLSLAGFYADNVGEGNRAKAVALLDKLPNRPPLYDGLRKRLAELDALGPTLATVRFVEGAEAIGRDAALAAAVEKDRTKKDCKTIKPLRVQRLGPVEKPVWLPLATPDMKQAYLMQGQWREVWTFDVCGAETGALLNFTADGLGGAQVLAPK